MKQASMLLTILTTSLLIFGFIIGCDSNSTEYQIEDTSVQDSSGVQLSKDITEEENEAIIFMREEEKLARDIYLSFFDIYGLRIFSNISKSEQKHMDALKVLLNSYGIQDPVYSDIIGKFQNPHLQNLFNELLERGKTSKTEALLVGAAIEEIDILDLLKSIENPDINSDVFIVFNNLKKGSENHLRSFAGNLKVNGIVYEPGYLSLDYYNSIIKQ